MTLHGRRWYAPGVGVCAALFLAIVGIDVIHAIALGLAVAAVIHIATSTDLTRDEGWPREPGPGRDGARGDLAVLAWSMIGRSGRVGEPVKRRLVVLARRRLARIGLDLDVPDDAGAIRDLIGTRAWDVLTLRGDGLPTVPDIEHTVGRLELLDPDRPDRPSSSTAAPVHRRIP